MPIPKRYYDELQQKRQEEHRVAERDKSRDLFRTGVLCLVWCVAGLVVFAFAFHTADPVLAEEFGAGPNLYPLILAAAASRRVEAVDASAGNIAYLERQIQCGPDASWLPFHALCRRLNPDLPATLAGALAHVNVVHADVRELEPAGYELASMHFVAEGATEDYAEFTDFCRAFVRCVVPGGHLVAAFMENMPTYRIGPVSRWPGCPVDPEIVTRVFTPMTRDLSVRHIDTDPTLPDYGDSGMVPLTAVAR